MKITFRQRLAIMGLLLLVFLLIYGIARHYSSTIVAYVVEEALLQKAPEGMSPATVRQRFDAALASTSQSDRLLRLLSLSSYIEKVQKLTPAELDRLLSTGGTAPGPGS
jgi:hypothetical protein